MLVSRNERIFKQLTNMDKTQATQVTAVWYVCVYCTLWYISHQVTIYNRKDILNNAKKTKMT